MSNKKMMKHGREIARVRIPLVAALVLMLPVMTQAATVTLPGAGSLLQEIKPVGPTAPSATETGLQVQEKPEVLLPPTAPFIVQHIQIKGNTLIDTAILHALVANDEGKSVTLQQLDTLATRITDYYHEKGYPLTRAVIPVQTIRDGQVEIDIIEASYGKIKLNNSSRVVDSLLQATLSPLQSGGSIEQSSLDRSLLLLSDIPGAAISATLLPGQSVGTSDLQVDISQISSVSSNVSLDNDGSRFTGRERVNGAVNFIDPFSHGDVLSLTGLSSGNNMNYGRLSYETLLSGSGTRLGGAYSALHYILGDSLANIGGHGTAQVTNLWLKQPFVRGRNVNFSGELLYEHKKLNDEVDVSGIKTDRHEDNWTASLTGDLRDGVLFGAISTWNVGMTSGQLSYDDAAAQITDASTARTQGEFQKMTMNVTRLQSLSARDSVQVNLFAQWSSNNLDSSEQMVAGGPYSVRAYDMGALSGDSGYLGTVEFRHDLNMYAQGKLQAVVFMDSEHITINKNTWTTSTNDATLSGVGAGFNWTGPAQWTAQVYVAKPVGSMPSLIDTSKSIRCWVQLAKGF
jgi:hemolysin activation/secretion protein